MERLSQIWGWIIKVSQVSQILLFNTDEWVLFYLEKIVCTNTNIIVCLLLTIKTL